MRSFGVFPKTKSSLFNNIIPLWRSYVKSYCPWHNYLYWYEAFWIVLKPKSWIGLMHKLAILNRTTKTYYNTIPWVELVLQKKQVNQGGRRIIVKWHCRVSVWEAHGWKDLKLGFFHNFGCLIIYFAI